MECLRSESNKVCDNQPTNLIMSPGSKTVISKQTKACENLHQDCNQKHKGDRYCKGSCNPALLQNLSTVIQNWKLRDKPLSHKIAPTTECVLKNIEKRIIHGSVEKIPLDCQACGGGLAYPKETKFIFHYQVRKLDEDCTVIDDTRKYGKTMELYSGKEFQLEFWEQCLGTMLPGEVSSFVVPAERLASFPAVNKKLRDYMLNKKDHSVKHCCGLMSLQEQGGLGYSDLDELMMKPEPLEFIFDLVKVEIPGTGRKDTWIMTPEEKFATVPVLREEGNQLYSHGEYNKAAICYSEALGILDQLILREKPGEPEWIELDKSRIPLFVNLAQCQFKEKNYYAAIQNTTEALSRDPTNIKALYRRSKAYIETWDLDLATEDLRKLAICRPDMKKTVENELNMIESKRVDQEIKERQKLAGKLCTRPKLVPESNSH